MKNKKSLIIKPLGTYLTGNVNPVAKGLCCDKRKYTELDILLMINGIKYNKQ